MDRKTELVLEEDAGWAEFLPLVEAVDDTRAEQVGYTREWSVKDLMAHVGGWQAETVQVLEQIRFGTFVKQPIDVDELNRQFVQANRDLPVRVVRAEMCSARTRMLQEWDALPDVTPDAEEWFVESGAEHYVEHRPRLTEWVEELGLVPRTRRRVGVMGGTFDPIHQGHLVTAEEALWQFHLDEVLFVPTGRPWMKSDREVALAEDRYLMTVIATSSNPHFTVSRVEVDREGPTYTVDTLRSLRAQYDGSCELFFITGADAMLEILHWKDPGEVLDLAHFIAATRPGYDIDRFEEEAPSPHPNVSVMDVPALAISSSDIRRRVSVGEPIRYLVPEGVQAYIEKAGLYRQRRTEAHEDQA